MKLFLTFVVESVGILFKGEFIKAAVILFNDIVLWCKKTKAKSLEFFRLDNLSDLSASNAEDIGKLVN